MYYVPAPGKRVAVYRDWVLLGLAKVLGLKTVFHWLAGGLDEWVTGEAKPWERFISEKIYGRAKLSIVPVNSETNTAAYFHPEAITIIPTGIPDPCRDFETSLLPIRRNRLEKRRQATGSLDPVEFRCLFMAHCTADKGLFDAMEAVGAANRKLMQDGAGVFVTLHVYGSFLSKEEQTAYVRLADKLNADMQITRSQRITFIQHLGFVVGAEKNRVLREADLLCFPTYYAAEVIPTVIIDAMAYGLPVVSTDWRGVPELLPTKGLQTCLIKRPDEVAQRILEAISFADFNVYRKAFLARFEAGRFVTSMARAFISAKNDSPGETPLARPLL
jgi:glycosyltransferase involved in cell wall biosynthesis